MQNNDGISNWWYFILTVGGVFAIINIIKAFKKPAIEAHEEYELIISEKDKIIKQLEFKIEIYQKLLDHDRNGNDKLE